MSAGTGRQQQGWIAALPSALAAASPGDRPPYFGLAFAICVAGMAVFLLGGGLVRNAFVPGPPGERGQVDELLESESMLFQLFGVALLVFVYPIFAWRRQLPLWPWLVLLAGMAMTGGPMLFWAWWHGQI
ncbi:MAG: hypothetical protein WKG00_30170 [Polyangiaceae bacterium]